MQILYKEEGDPNSPSKNTSTPVRTLSNGGYSFILATFESPSFLYLIVFFWNICLFSAQLISLSNCRDDVREDELLSKLLYKAYFGKVFKYVVVYAAKDHLNTVFL